MLFFDLHVSPGLKSRVNPAL